LPLENSLWTLNPEGQQCKNVHSALYLYTSCAYYYTNSLTLHWHVLKFKYNKHSAALFYGFNQRKEDYLDLKPPLQNGRNACIPFILSSAFQFY